MRNSIIIKIFVAFLTVSLIPICILIAYNDWASRRIVYNMKIEDIKKQTEKLANNIDQYLLLKKERILCLSSYVVKMTANDALSPPVIDHLRAFIKQLPPSESVFILDTHGNIAVSNIPDVRLHNYRQRDFFREAMKGITYISEPAIDGGKGYGYCSTPVRTGKNEITAILVMRWQTEELWQLFEAEKDFLGKGSSCILTDGYGVRIAHATDRSLNFKSWVTLKPDMKNALETEHHYGEDVKEIGFTNIPEVSRALAQDAVLYFVHPLIINTENNHGYCMPLKEKNWKLIYTVPASTFLEQIRHLTINALYSSCIVFVVIIITTWILSAYILKPIKILTHSAYEIANGNLDHPMSNGSHDEIGKLMKSFEVMRHKLKNSYKELKSANIETILMLARACEVRDEDTGNHIMRINYYSTAVAKEMSMDESFIKELGPSSTLHDVGKIHIPDDILKKQGPLTVSEREMVMKHPVWGEMILGSSRFFQMAREITRWHHENWDGSGYPDGLKGTEIPMAARIVRIVDAYDALIMKRPYKDAWTEHEAYNNIVEHSGTFFDPGVTDAFTHLFKKGFIQEIKMLYV